MFWPTEYFQCYFLQYQLLFYKVRWNEQNYSYSYTFSSLGIDQKMIKMHNMKNYNRNTYNINYLKLNSYEYSQNI